MKKENRIKKNHEIASIVNFRKKVVNRSFVIYYKENENEKSRFAFSVSKKFGHAFERNKAKRISRNLARIRTENDIVKVGFSSRAYSREGLDFSTTQLEMLICTIGARYRHHEGYPSWQDDAASPLVLKYQKSYNEVTGRETLPTLIHAGLECGVITSRVEGLSAISVGANVHNLHTPQETIELDSMDRVYDTIRLFLSE